ncbi:DedA family protein [Brevibacillus ginsengisoli]|uniref:DedA family protein n=1 Tax=Brevibacillus ginsengisoli TaxID=363854 RepID=UPI003CEBDC81
MFHQLVINFIAHYGYIGLFGALMLGVIGLPIPDELLMTYSGYLVSIHQLRFSLVILVAALGSVCGMSVSFWIGHQFGYPLLEKYGRKIHLSPERIRKSEVWFERFGKFAVIIGYFVPGVRHVTSISAGISKWPYRSFLLYALPGGFLWAGCFTVIGYYVGENWHRFVFAFHRYAILIVISLVILALLVYGIRTYLARRVKAK